MIHPAATTLRYDFLIPVTASLTPWQMWHTYDSEHPISQLANIVVLTTSTQFIEKRQVELQKYGGPATRPWECFIVLLLRAILYLILKVSESQTAWASVVFKSFPQISENMHPSWEMPDARVITSIRMHLPMPNHYAVTSSAIIFSCTDPPVIPLYLGHISQIQSRT